MLCIPILWVPNLNNKPKNLLPSYLSQNCYITKVIAKINKKSAENQGCCSKNCSKKRSQKQQIFSKIFEEKWNFSKTFKFDYIHQFFSYFDGWECKKHLNLSNFSNLKSTARTETFARQKITMKKIDSINFALFNAYFLKKPIFMHARESARAIDKHVEKLNNCKCVLHFESSKYLKNRWN